MPDKIPWERFYEDHQPGSWREYWTNDDLLFSAHLDTQDRPLEDSTRIKAGEFNNWSEFDWLDDDFLI